MNTPAKNKTNFLDVTMSRMAIRMQQLTLIISTPNHETNRNIKAPIQLNILNPHNTSWSSPYHLKDWKNQTSEINSPLPRNKSQSKNQSSQIQSSSHIHDPERTRIHHTATEWIKEARLLQWVMTRSLIGQRKMTKRKKQKVRPRRRSSEGDRPLRSNERRGQEQPSLKARNSKGTNFGDKVGEGREVAEGEFARFKALF